MCSAFGDRYAEQQARLDSGAQRQETFLVMVLILLSIFSEAGYGGEKFSLPGDLKV